MSATVEFSVGDKTASGYAAAPSGVVVLQEWWGLVPHIEDVTRRFQAEGYVALAPDLYHGEKTVEAAEAQHLMEGLDWPRAVAEITGAVSYLRSIGCAKVGVVGFCMGGALSMLAAANAGVDAAVAFYGFPPEGDPRGKECPPSLVFFGEHEEFFPVPDAKEWVEAQKAAGRDSELTIYPGAGHAFFNDTRPEAYHEASAKDAWGKTLAHFKKHL